MGATVGKDKNGDRPLGSPEPPQSSPSAMQTWWDNSGRKANAETILGTAAVSAKGSAAFLLKHLVDTGVLDARRFATPDTFLIASDAVSRGKPKELRTPKDREQVIDTFSRSRVIGQSLLHARSALNLDPGMSVIVRSLGLAEGSAGQSAAGIYESVETSASLSDLRKAAQRVAESAFSPRALTLNREFGLPDAFPGLLIQPLLQGIHCVFHTSRPGQVGMTIQDFNNYWPVYESFGTFDPKAFSYKAPPMELRELVHEAAAILSNNGAIPIECEMMYMPGRKVGVMLQHRFVTALDVQAFPQHDTPLAETKYVVGSNTHKENWIVDMRFGNYNSLAKLWLIQQRLKAEGVTSFGVLMSSSALSSLSGKDKWYPDATFAPLRLGSAFVEDDGGKYHESSSESHKLRLAYDKGAISMYMDFDVDPIRAAKVEELSPDPSWWNPNDALFLDPGVVDRMGEVGGKCGVSCYRTRTPVIFVADENVPRGAIYLS